MTTDTKTADATFETRIAAPVSLLPDSSGPQPSRPVAGLAKGLHLAQQQVRAAAHDKRNEFHRFNYTSAEAIIQAAQEAFAGTGLSMFPAEQLLTGWERTGADRFELNCRWLLLHESGESLPLVVCWPVTVEKGRPLDKATAVASTSALAYLLRSLLLMPRVEQADEANSRDDTAYAPPAAAAKPATVKQAVKQAVAASAEPPNGPFATPEMLRDCHLALSAAGKGWAKALAHFGCGMDDRWEPPTPGIAGADDAARMTWITAEVCRNITAMVSKAKPKAAPVPN